jgi:hypothetical protein
MPVLRPVRAISSGSQLAHSMKTLVVSSVTPERMPPMTPPRHSGPVSSAITVMVSSSV